MIQRTYPTSLLLILVVGAAACHGGSGSAIVAKDPSGSPARSGANDNKAGSPSQANGATQPIGASGVGGAVALAKVKGRRVAFVADEDAKAILTIDAETRAQIAETKLGGIPGQVLVTRDGRVLATVRDTNKLVAFRIAEPDAPLAQLRTAETPAEPIAIAVTPDEQMILVSTGWGQKLAAFDGSSLASKFDTKLPREPRAIAVSDDGKVAYVSHAVGSVMSAVDLAGPKHGSWVLPMRGKNPQAIAQVAAARKTADSFKKHASSPLAQQQLASMSSLEKRAVEGRQSCQGFVLAKSTSTPNRIFAPQVMVDPGDLEKRPTGYGDAAIIPEVPAVAVIDEAAGEALATSMAAIPSTHLGGFAGFQHDPRLTAGECLLPRAAAIDPNSQSLLVTCFGIDSVIAYDAMSSTPARATRKHWNVGAGPTGIAVDPETHQAFVFSQFDRSISVLKLDAMDELVDDKGNPPAVTKTALAPLRDGNVSPQFIVGRMLFHASGDIRISNDGRACASCHPDGRDDAITWATPEGPRRSIMLAGRVSKTPPYSWDGNASTIETHLSATFQRLKGHGLRSFELEALVAYVSGLPAPPARAIDPRDKAKVDRGQKIFASSEAGCSSCHSGTDFTDGMNHDVQSKHNADRAEKFNTPSLRMIGGTGPYFHDGRYASLPELLRKSDGKMGHTKHLTNADLDALTSYLETL